jgi:hypothetical protein
MSVEDYLAPLDWTDRQPVDGKRGVTPADTPACVWGLSPMCGANWLATLTSYSVW